MSQRSFASAEYALKKKRTRREKFLAEMERVVPWSRLIPVIEPLYPASGRVGRQPIGVPRMLSMYCLHPQHDGQRPPLQSDDKGDPPLATQPTSGNGCRRQVFPSAVFQTTLSMGNAGFVARVHMSIRGRLETLAGSHDAVGHGNLVARSDAESTHRIATVANT